MKFEKILACAVGAGLLTFAAGNARALVIDDAVAPVVNAQLTIKWTDENGKTKSASITSKDLIEAIGDDQDEDFSGDEVVLVDNEDYWLVNKHGDQEEDLTEDDVISYVHTELTESDHEGAHGSFKDSQTGVASLTFASNGDDDGTVDIEDNEIYISQEDAAYTSTATGAAVTHGDKQVITITEKGGVDTEGYDFNVFDNGDEELPIFGTITQTGSGTVVEP